MPRIPKRRLTEAEKEYRREYYRSHKERMNAQTRAWFERNKGRHYELTQRRYSENKEAHLAKSKEWSAANLPKKAQASRRRRAARLGATGVCTDAQLAARIAFFGGRCAYCGAPYEEVDHAIPLSRGGTNWPSNLRPSCRHCNRSKHAKTVSEFQPTELN